MKIEIEKQDSPQDLEISLENVVKSFTELSQSIIQGDLNTTEKVSLQLKQGIADLEKNAQKIGEDHLEEAELDALINQYEKENMQMNIKVRELEEKSQKAQKTLNQILNG